MLNLIICQCVYQYIVNRIVKGVINITHLNQPTKQLSPPISRSCHSRVRHSDADDIKMGIICRPRHWQRHAACHATSHHGVKGLLKWREFLFDMKRAATPLSRLSTMLCFYGLLLVSGWGRAALA